jgi:hypothetical protein
VGLAFDVADRLSLGAASKVFGPLKSMMEGLQSRVDPVYLGMRMLSLMTAGISSTEFSLDKEQLLKSIMMLHFVECRKMFDLAGLRFSMTGDGAGPLRPQEK